MAVKWTCPNCNGEMYSAWPRQGEPEVTCIYCAKRFKNPYFIQSSDDTMDKKAGEAQ